MCDSINVFVTRNYISIEEIHLWQKIHCVECQCLAQCCSYQQVRVCNEEEIKVDL